MDDRMNKSEEEWKQELTPEQYHVLREKGTEPPFTGKFYNNHDTGMYVCGACGNELFSSTDKFDSGSGWPSFDKPVAEGRIRLEQDGSHGMVRTEVVCARCGSHLGHVFDDGPKETTGQRFCINSCALGFNKGLASPPQ